MKALVQRIPDKQKRLVAGAAGGFAGAAAYALAQAVDMKVFDNNTDDFILLGRLFSGDEGYMRAIGGTLHFVNGAALGAIYALAVRERLPGSPLARGLTFAMIETVGLYPIALLERFHPGIREGRLPSYLTPTAFAQQVVRHIAYGAALGPTTEALLHLK